MINAIVGRLTWVVWSFQSFTLRVLTEGSGKIKQVSLSGGIFFCHTTFSKIKNCYLFCPINFPKYKDIQNPQRKQILFSLKRFT